MERKLHMNIKGMYCEGCAGRIEKALAAADGVVSAAADYGSGCADVLYDELIISYEEMVSLLEALDYDVLSGSIEDLNGKTEPVAGKNGLPEGENRAELQGRKEINPVLRGLLLVAAILALFVVLQLTGALKVLAPGQLAESSMSYGMLFVLGLITSVHCIAMCGGINLSQSLPRSTDVYTGRKDRMQAFLPPLLYNLGRVCSYTLIGLILGTVGFLIGGGGTVGLSSLLQGIIKIIAGVFMILMGIRMLNLFPGIRKRIPQLSKGLAAGISKGKRAGGPFIIGLLNGIMPCGPLQAMWIVAFASADPLAGALSMFFFSLGTSPLMLGFGSVVAALGKKFKKAVLTIGAVLVVVLGIAMLSQGGTLSGWFSLDSLFAGNGRNTARIKDGVQIVNSVLEPGSYPDITVQAGLPVRWEIEAPEGSINGCNYKILIPEYGMEYTFEPGENVIEFTPEQAGEVGYNCWMGMIYGTITVTD